MDMKYFREIYDERERQDLKWGQQDHAPYYWLIILMEEVGECAHAICGKNHNHWDYRKELIQVAAVAVAAMESFDRQNAELA